MRRSYGFAAFAFIAQMVLAPGTAHADDAALLARIEALESELKLIKAQLETKKEESDKKEDETPVITAAAKEGFTIKASNDSYKLKITGYTQAEGKFFTDNRKDLGTTDTFQVRTVRLTAMGTVAKDYDFFISPEFAGTSVNLPDAYMDVHTWPEFKLRAGKFKEPFGLERLQSTTILLFAELGLPSNLGPNRDAGFQLFGDLAEDRVSYAVGVFNGVEDLGTSITDSNQDKDVAARLFITPFRNTEIQPLKGLGAGIAMTYGHKEGTTGSLPTYRSPGQASVFSYSSAVSADGPNSRFSPQFSYTWNSLGVFGEYVSSSEEALRTVSGQIIRDRFTNTAWQIAGSYVLTGEDASYKGVTPRHPFNRGEGTWGAFEIAARYGELDIDDSIFSNNFASESASISGERAWALGLNWYLSRNFRFLLDYEQTGFTGGAALSQDRETENVIWSRLQIQF